MSVKTELKIKLDQAIAFRTAITHVFICMCA